MLFSFLVLFIVAVCVLYFLILISQVIDQKLDKKFFKRNSKSNGSFTDNSIFGRKSYTYDENGDKVIDATFQRKDEE